MGDVIRLAQFQNSDTVALLRALTIAAINGDVIGVEGELRTRSGRPFTFSSGTFAVKYPLAADGTDPSKGK